MTISSPPSITFSEELKAKLVTSLMQKGCHYKPRTQYLHKDGSPVYTNRLIQEGSPYLLQHAHNPVNWYAWGKGAFDAAKAENKPIFLSIGYATCHWCHVMEEESFDNIETARLLNQHFIAIKVDREQHPDVDATYMAAVMLINRQGGWPLNSFISPDGNTFYGGTYFQPKAFRKLLIEVNQSWHDQHATVINQSKKIAAAVNEMMQSKQQAASLPSSLLEDTSHTLDKQFDHRNKGFGLAPKFPHESSLLFLLEQQRQQPDASRLKLINGALHAMAQGGIYDQIRGGFHRYSTDAQWQVPHFEKMLYNQALLARVYLEGWQLTANPMYLRVVTQTLDAMLDGMRSPEGGFYSATDADSDGKEGLFFIWSKKEFESVLKNKSFDKSDIRLALDYYSVSKRGNFEGQNILHRSMSDQAFAQKSKLSMDELYAKFDNINQALIDVRSQRIPPLRDDKIITAWNGMMIHTLALAGEVLSNDRYLQAAQKAANFIWEKNRSGDETFSELWRTTPLKGMAPPATQEDYAYLAESYLVLYDATGSKTWLNRAKTLSETMIHLFEDTAKGGFYMNQPNEQVPLMTRPREGMDNAIPSGNSVALRALSMLAKRDNDPKWSTHAEKLIASFSGELSQYPEAFTYMMKAFSEIRLGESGRIQYAGKGHVSVHSIDLSKNKGEKHLRLDIKLDKGWHINAPNPIQDYLIPTSIKLGEQSISVTYPLPIEKHLGFAKEIVRIYEGHISIGIRQSSKDQDSLHAGEKLLLAVQACSDTLCLAPELLEFGIPLF